MQFDFSVGPNQSQHIDVTGTFVKYVGGSGTIRVRLNGGGYIDLLPGQGVNNVQFNSIDVQDRTGAANAGTILAGIYDFRDDRITGTVDIVDGGKARTKANQAFSAAVLGLGAAGLYTTCQIYNPSISGKLLICSKMIITTDTGGAIAKIGWNQGINGNSLPAGAVTSKLSNGPNSASRHFNNGLAGEPAGFRYLGVFQTSSSAPFVYQFAEPVVLTPGYGLSVQHGVLGSGSLQVTFEFIEEPI